MKTNHTYPHTNTDTQTHRHTRTHTHTHRGKRGRQIAGGIRTADRKAIVTHRVEPCSEAVVMSTGGQSFGFNHVSTGSCWLRVSLNTLLESCWPANR